MSGATKEVMDLFQKMLNPQAYPLQGLMFPPTDPVEMERKIRELQTVKAWLEASVGALDLAIKTMEMQRSFLTPKTPKTPKTASEPTEAESEAAAKTNPALWAWELMQKAATGTAAKAAAMAEDSVTAFKAAQQATTEQVANAAKTAKRATTRATEQAAAKVAKPPAPATKRRSRAPKDE